MTTKKTNKDLKEIATLKRLISKLTSEIAGIKKACPHQDRKLDTISTFSHEQELRYICIVCSRSSEDKPSDEEAREYWEAWFDWYEDDEQEQKEKVILKCLKDGGYTTQFDFKDILDDN